MEFSAKQTFDDYNMRTETSANVFVLPTDKTIAELKAKGLVLVHKPIELEALRAEKEARKS